MPKSSKSLLLVDLSGDTQAMLDPLAAEIEIQSCGTLEEARQLCRDGRFAAAVLDLCDQTVDLDLLRDIQRAQPEARIILQAARPSLQAARAVLPRVFACCSGQADAEQLTDHVRRAIADDSGPPAGPAAGEPRVVPSEVESREAHPSPLLATLAELSCHALQRPPLEQLMDRVVHVVADALDVQFAKILALSPSGAELLLQSGLGWRAGVVGAARVPNDAGSQAGYTLRSDTPVVVESFEKEARFTAPQLLVEHQVASGLSAVIQGPGKPFGVLGAHCRQPRRYRSEEVDFLQAVANILALGILESQDEQRIQQARYQLKASEIRYRDIVETTQEWIWELDLNGVHTFSNPAIERILGYPPSEIVGRSCFDLLHEEDRRQVDQRLPQLVRNVEGWTDWTLRWRCRDGRFRYLESNATPMFDDRGEHCGYRGADRDVTDRIEAELAVRRNERSLAKAQQIAHIGNWELHPDTMSATASDELRRIVGLGLGEPLPNFDEFVAEFVHPDDQQQIREAQRRARVEGITDAVEFRIQQPDRQLRHLRAEAEIVRTEDGRPQAIIGTLQDISEQKVVELALRASEEKFRVLSEKSPAIVMIVRAQHVVYCNPTLGNITGYSLNELLKLDIMDVIHPDDRATVADRHRRRLAGENVVPRRYEIKIVTKSGEVRWLDQSVERIEFNGEASVLVTAVDITQRKLALERLQEMELQLAHVSRLSTMGEMVAGIAHEINQPLSAIANFSLASRLALENSGGLPADDVPIDSWLENVSLQAVRCGDIIRRLRDFVNKGEENRRWLDLNQVVLDSIALIGIDLRYQTVAIESCLPDSPPHIMADQVQLQQVVINLLRNACDATAGLNAQVRIQVEFGEDQAELVVEDNGAGIAESHKPQLFDPFFTTKPDGMGMGLAISRSIIEAHNGALYFESRQPHGARFVVRLPLRGGDGPRNE